MAFTPISQLFSARDVHFENSDIQYGIDAFLQQELHSEKVHCKLVGASMRADICVGSTAVEEGILVREKDIRDFAVSHFECLIGEIRAILEV